jgi:hypothetical protein
MSHLKRCLSGHEQTNHEKHFRIPFKEANLLSFRRFRPQGNKYSTTGSALPLPVKDCTINWEQKKCKHLRTTTKTPPHRPHCQKANMTDRGVDTL